MHEECGLLGDGSANAIPVLEPEHLDSLLHPVYVPASAYARISGHRDATARPCKSLNDSQSITEFWSRWEELNAPIRRLRFGRSNVELHRLGSSLEARDAAVGAPERNTCRPESLRAISDRIHYSEQFMILSTIQGRRALFRSRSLIPARKSSLLGVAFHDLFWSAGRWSQSRRQPYDTSTKFPE